MPIGSKRFMPVAAILALSAVVPLTAPIAAPLMAQDAKQQDAAQPKTTTPKLLYKVEPSYTEEAKAAKISGSVLLKLVVDENGNAQDIQVARSLDQGLDRNAIAAVRQWVFAPATENGKPVAVAANIEVNFSLL
jgi:TonB family protein